MEVQKVTARLEKEKSTPKPIDDLLKKSIIIIGLSLGNKYFSNKKLKELLSWAKEKSETIFIMIPDHPFIHTLLAKGMSKNKAIKVARLKGNNLSNKCRIIIQEIFSESNYCFPVRWTFFENSSSNYKFRLAEIKTLYRIHSQFREDVINATSIVLSSNNIPVHSSSIEEGVNFLFMEFAYILSCVDEYKGFKNKEFVSYVYHQENTILQNIILGNYNNYKDNNDPFIKISNLVEIVFS